MTYPPRMYLSASTYPPIYLVVCIYRIYPSKVLAAAAAAAVAKAEACAAADAAKVAVED